MDPIEIETIKNSRLSILHHDNKVWRKKNGLFDITMGSYDGAQVTDLVGLYILYLLKKEIPEIDFGLYRDYGLGIHRRIPATKLNMIKKKIKAIFERLGLKITMETNLTNVNFLDVTFNLHNESYHPFRKPNDNPIYIHTSSNHPPHVKKNLPTAINKRLSDLSTNEKMFNENKEIYQNALRKGNHNHKLKYNIKNQKEPQNINVKKNRNRKQIWFTPPYNSSLITNIGQEFLKLIDKHFPKNKPLSAIFNRKTIKIGYSCTKNMEQIINNHNRNIIKQTQQQSTTEKNCNCRNKDKCPVKNKCLSQNVVYKATLPSGINYIGMTSNTFKTRYTCHSQTFRDQSKQNSTTLAQYIWRKQLGPNPNIKWEILKTSETYQPGQNTCNLCTEEKIQILKQANNPNNINSRSDFSTLCIHQKRFTFNTQFNTQ